MSYMNDPREKAFNTESGVMMEQDNRREEVYQWGAMITDLCDLPVEEYMSPMKVIVLGSSLPETGATQYTLKFVIDGVTVKQEKIASGDPIQFDVSADKEGRNFLGWYTNTDVLYSEGALMPSKSLTLTAKYSCDVKFMFSIDGIDEEISLEYEVPYNTVVTEVPSLDRSGLSFLGWEPSIYAPVKQHTLFKGSFESIVYTVTWNGYEDGSIEQRYTYGETLVMPENNPVKEGHTFIGWDKEVPSQVTEILEFNAVFNVNQYKITYFSEYNGEKYELSSVTVNFGSKIVLPNLPSDEGYTFANWVGYNGKTMPSHDIEYVTVKTINSYILAYYVDGIDSDAAVNTVEYEYMSPIEDYTFEKEGYYPVTEWPNIPSNMPSHDVDVHGVTEIMKFNVEFIDKEGNSVKKVEDVIYGTVVETIIPTDTVEFKYEVNESDKTLVVKEDLTIIVTKIKQVYKVTFVNDGIESQVEMEYGASIDEYVNANFVAEEGYTMNVSKTHETVPGNNTARVEITYKANQWTLSWSTSGAGEQDFEGSKVVTFGSPIMENLPTGELEGFNFSGWFIGENKVTELDVMPNNNVSVNGTYEVIMLHVNVKDGETVVLSKDYAYGTSISEVVNDNDVVSYIAELDKNGYVGTLNLNDVETIKSDLDIQIERTEKEYVLTFMNGETLISSAIVKFNSVITYPEMSGYTENGVEYVFTWEDNSYNGQTMPAMDLIIVGNYQEKPVAPIYFGSYVIPTSAYDESNVSQYFDETKLNTSYYDSINIKECVGAGSPIILFMPGYEPFADLSDRQAKKECKNYYQPPVFIIPISVVEKYSISILDGIGTNEWPNFITDNNVINIDGNDYYFYSRIPNETLTPGKYDSEDLKVTLKLTEK